MKPEKISIKFISTAGNYFIVNADVTEDMFVSLDPEGEFGKTLIERYNALSVIDHPKEWVEQAKQIIETDGGEKVRLLIESRKRIAELEKAMRSIEKMSRYSTNHDEMLYAMKDINEKAKQLIQ